MNKSNTNSEMGIVECIQPDILSPEEHEALLEWSMLDWGKIERAVFKLHSSHLFSFTSRQHQTSKETPKNPN